MFTDEEQKVVEKALSLQADLYWEGGDEEKMEVALQALEKVKDK